MTTEGADRFDGILLNVAQQAGSIENILDVFFGFLQRKTDFFSGEVDPSKPEKMVLDSFKKHHKCGQKKRDEEREKNRISDEQRRKKVEEQKKRDLEEYDLREREKKEAKIEEVSEDTPLGVQKSDEEKVQKTDEEKVEKAEPEEEKKADDDDDDDQTPQPLGNGGSTDKYTWTQTLSTLELMVHVRPGIRAKEVILDIGVDKLKVQIKGEEPIILGKLHSKVKPDDSMWTLIDNKIIQVSLEKLDQMKWWSCVMEGDPEINTRKIVPENSKLGDLDGETRQTVEKMMFDQRAKAAGLPTSDQQKQHEMLDKFKAQHPEMDFSNCKMNYGGGSGGGFNFN